jgi:hypothetical protein
MSMPAVSETHGYWGAGAGWDGSDLGLRSRSRIGDGARCAADVRLATGARHMADDILAVLLCSRS